MSTSVIVVNIEIPELDTLGAFIDYTTFFKQMAALSVSGQGAISGQMNVYDGTYTYVGQSTILTFFLLASNSAAALADYTAFHNSLASGTVTNVWYSTSTLGV